MAEKKDKTYSSNAGSFLQGAFGQVANAVGSAAQGGSNGGGGGTDFTSQFGISLDPSQILDGQDKESAPPTIQEMLLGTSMDVTGRRGLGGRDLNGALPLWAQGTANAIQAAVTQPGHTPEWYTQANKNAAGWDPYLGVLGDQGDDRVYLGDAHMTIPDYFNELDDSLDVNAKDPKKRAKAREQNQQVDRQNKVDRQLGNDPTQEVAGEHKVKTDGTATATQVKNQPYLWDDEKVAASMKAMRQAGIPVKGFEDLLSAWGSLVDRASATFSLSAGKRKVTPWDVLDMYKSEAKAAGSFVDYEKRMNGSTTSTSRSVSELTEGQAFTALQGQLSQMLGRDPSDQEIRDFAYRMNHLAARNPSITKTITKFKNGEAVGSNSSTTGGFGADDVAQAAYEDAQSDPGYAEYQSASTYFNAAMTALGGLGEG